MTPTRLYRHRPTVIEAVELTQEMVDGFQTVRQVVFERRSCLVFVFNGVHVWVTRRWSNDVVGYRGFEVWNERGRAWVAVSVGDFLCVERQEDVYPIAAATFAERYELVQEGP